MNLYGVSIETHRKVKEMEIKRESELLFSEIIKFRRKALNMKLRDLSILTGLSPSFLYRLESGERHQPSVQTVAKIAKVLELDLMFLIHAIIQNDKGDITHG